MRPPEALRIAELDEDLEVCGESVVPATRRVIPQFPHPEFVAGYRFFADPCFSYVKEIRIGWFAHEECMEYELSNRSVYYLEVHLEIEVQDEAHYDSAWTRFRQAGVTLLSKRLGLSSWGVGRGIVDRRGQDLFIVELDGFDQPGWVLYMTVSPSHTFGDCWARAMVIEESARDDLLRVLRA